MFLIRLRESYCQTKLSSEFSCAHAALKIERGYPSISPPRGERGEGVAYTYLFHLKLEPNGAKKQRLPSRMCFARLAGHYPPASLDPEQFLNHIDACAFLAPGRGSHAVRLIL